MKTLTSHQLLVVATAAVAAPALAATSDVLRFTVPDIVDGRYDLEVLLFHRDGKFHHGYARTPGRDNLVHRVDVTPSKPIQWQTADGKAIDVPEKMRGCYSYTDKEEFARWKSRYEKGEIKVGHPIPTPPIAWDGEKFSGVVDVLIGGVDVANTSGRDPHDVPYRIVVDGGGKPGGKLTGQYTLWTYERKDDDYGEENEKLTGDLIDARLDTEYWKPAKGTEYVAGRDWPQARGPMLTGAAIDSATPLIKNLHDARLLWVAEEVLPGGRGAVLSRGGFAMYPYAWQNTGFGGFSGPVVAGGKVYQYLTMADEDLVANDEDIASNVYVELGADPRFLGNDHGYMRDTVLCFDARTGRTLWRFTSDGTFRKVKEGKGGVATTMCVYDGKAYARGSGGLYCLDAESGHPLWLRSGDAKGDDKVNYGLSGGWSHDMSPVVIGGVLVMTHGGEGDLAGVDPATGDLLWCRKQAGGFNAVPTKAILGGKEYIIVASSQQDRLSLIQPSDGNVIWTTDAFGRNNTSLSVCDAIIAGNVANTTDSKDNITGAARFDLKGAERIWQSDEAGYPPGRSTPVAHKGYFYIDDRSSFWCIEAATGRVVKRQPHIYTMTGGSHNWVWTIASNDRIFTSGVLMFTTGAAGFERMPGRLSLELADGYTAPIKPAIADGRLFARLGDKLVCYDLRRDRDQKSQMIELTAENGYASSIEPGSAVRLKVRVLDGRVARVYCDWPEIVGPEARQVADWITDYGRALGGTSCAAGDLMLTNERLSGSVSVSMGWHDEYWTLDLKRQGDRFIGRFVRSVPAVKEPVDISGRIDGRVLNTERGKAYLLNLQEAATQLQRNQQKQPISVAIVETDRSLRGWAAGGRINGNVHEVDASGLAIANGRIAGKLTVIYRDDEHFDLNAEENTAVAGAYRIDTKIKDGAITGQHTGTMGTSWSREGKIRGSFGE